MSFLLNKFVYRRSRICICWPCPCSVSCRDPRRISTIHVWAWFPWFMQWQGTHQHTYEDYKKNPAKSDQGRSIRFCILCTYTDTGANWMLPEGHTSKGWWQQPSGYAPLNNCCRRTLSFQPSTLTWRITVSWMVNSVSYLYIARTTKIFVVVICPEPTKTHLLWVPQALYEKIILKNK